MATLDNPFQLPDAWGDKTRPFGYCLRCQEQLRFHTPDPSECHRCGWQFDPGRPETFGARRTFLRWKYWFPGFCLAVASGVLSYAICLMSGELGWSLFGAVPVSVGAILGYGTRVQTWLLTMLGILAIFTVVTTLVMMHYAGLFCGCTLGIIFIFPTAFGIICGVVLRLILKNSSWDQRAFFPLALMALFPYACQMIELALPNREEIAVVRTELKVDATPQEAWDAIMFYEDVTHSPPWILHLALPKPIRSEGDKSRVGGNLKCFYDSGYLSKRISRREEPRALAFEVTEQHILVEHDVALKDGSFEIEPTPDGKCLIRLTTRYERKLQPRFVWEPFEQHVVHKLHGHVLEGMRQKAEQMSPRPAEKPDPGSRPEGEVGPEVL